MDPLKRFLSFIGLFFVFSLAYAVFSGFFVGESRDTFDIAAPGRVIEVTAPIEPGTAAFVSGTLYYVTYPKGSVLYLENVFLRADKDLGAYLSHDPFSKAGPRIGDLISSRGNMTLYVPPAVQPLAYPYLVIWSEASDKSLAYVNLSRN